MVFLVFSVLVLMVCVFLWFLVLWFLWFCVLVICVLVIWCGLCTRFGCSVFVGVLDFVV